MNMVNIDLVTKKIIYINVRKLYCLQDTNL